MDGIHEDSYDDSSTQPENLRYTQQSASRGRSLERNRKPFRRSIGRSPYQGDRPTTRSVTPPYSRPRSTDFNLSDLLVFKPTDICHICKKPGHPYVKCSLYDPNNKKQAAQIEEARKTFFEQRKKERLARLRLDSKRNATQIAQLTKMSLGDVEAIAQEEMATHALSDDSEGHVAEESEQEDENDKDGYNSAGTEDVDGYISYGDGEEEDC